MSEFKQLPDRRRVQTWRTICIFAVIVSALALSYFQRHAEIASMEAVIALVVVLFGSIVFLMFIQPAGQCPDCGGSLSKIYEDSHLPAKDGHILYCKTCNVIWDAAIPKSSG